MSSVPIALGLLGLLAAVVWYDRLLDAAAPGVHVELGSAGGLTRDQVVLWLLAVMLSMSVLLVGLGFAPNGVTLVGSVALALLVTDVVRRWHNRGLAPPPVPPVD